MCSIYSCYLMKQHNKQKIFFQVSKSIINLAKSHCHQWTSAVLKSIFIVSLSPYLLPSLWKYQPAVMSELHLYICCNAKLAIEIRFQQNSTKALLENQIEFMIKSNAYLLLFIIFVHIHNRMAKHLPLHHWLSVFISFPLCVWKF